MPDPQSASAVFDREFLSLRGKIVEVAAALDRIARAGSVEGDPRFQQVCESLEVVARRGAAADRAERVQMVFSLPYNPEWRRRLPKS